MTGINPLSQPASSPFSVALSLYLKLSSSSKHGKVMMTKLSNSCAPSSALTKWSYAFLGSRIPPMLSLHNRRLPAGPRLPQLRLLHISPPCQRALPLTLLLHRNSINLPRQEVRLRKDLHQRLRPPLRLFLLPTLADPPPGMPTALLRPLVDPPGRLWGHTLIKDLPLQPVKAKALTQGRARALAPPTLMWLAKAKKAQKVKKARRVKKAKTPRATKATRGRKETTLRPFWKVVKVPPKGTRNNCSPCTRFVFSIPICSYPPPPLPPAISTPPSIASTLPVIPALSVLGSFLFSLHFLSTRDFPLFIASTRSRSFRPTRSLAASSPTLAFTASTFTQQS